MLNPYGESVNGNEDGWWDALRWDEDAHLKALRTCKCGRQKEYAHDEQCPDCTLDGILDKIDAESDDG